MGMLVLNIHKIAIFEWYRISKAHNSLKRQQNFAIKYKKIIVPKIPPGVSMVYGQLKVYAVLVANAISGSGQRERRSHFSVLTA